VPICPTDGKEFKKTINNQKFCSERCRKRYSYRKKHGYVTSDKGLKKICPVCETYFESKKTHTICCNVNCNSIRYHRIKKGFPISNSEYHKIRKRRRNGEGNINGCGYLVIGNKLEHRRVMEKDLDRELLPYETVHHINGDKLDNRIENLELWSSHHGPGQRVIDKLIWAITFIEQYGREFGYEIEIRKAA
jgi:hypothetical protein